MNVRELARLANVSPATVSIVLNDRPGVSEETRRRILEIVKEQNYSWPGRRAAGKAAAETGTALSRSIRFLKYKQHGMLVERNEGFVASIIDAVESEARKRGFNLVMTTLDSRTMPEVSAMVRQNPLDGVIILGTEMEPQDLEGLADLPVPLIMIDNYLPYLPVDSIVMNNAEIAYTAVGYLHGLGFREIGYWQSSVPISNFRQRESGFRDAVRDYRLICRPDDVIRLTPTIDGAYADLKTCLQGGVHLPPAIFADNDAIAIGAMRALREQGIQIPRDISVIGFDDLSAGRIVDPPLTTMHVFQEEIGRWAVRRIHDKITDQTKTVMKIQVGGQVIPRGSTAPAVLS